jgi:hypothetical protein
MKKKRIEKIANAVIRNFLFRDNISSHEKAYFVDFTTKVLEEFEKLHPPVRVWWETQKVHKKKGDPVGVYASIYNSPTKRPVHKGEKSVLVKRYQKVKDISVFVDEISKSLQRSSPCYGSLIKMILEERMNLRKRFQVYFAHYPDPEPGETQGAWVCESLNNAKNSRGPAYHERITHISRFKV